MKRPRHLVSLLLAVLVIGAALVYSVRTNPDWQTFQFGLFLKSLQDLNWLWLVPAFLGIYGTYVVRALRWRVLMRPLKADLAFGNLLSATVIGFGAVGLLGRAGEIVRPYLIARKENVPFSSQFAVWVLERCFDMLILLAAVAFAVGQVELSADQTGAGLESWLHAAGRMVGVLTVGVLVLLVLLRRYYNQLAGQALKLLGFLPPARIEAVRRAVWVFGDGLRSIRDTGSVVRCLLWSVLVWLLIAVSYYSVLAAFRSGPRLSVSQTLVFMGLVMAGSMVQIPGIGGGVQVTTLLALTEVFGVHVEVASAVALLIWALTFLAVVPPALLLLAWNGLSWGRLSQLEAEAETEFAR